MRRGIEGIEPSGTAHGRANGQRLAAGTGTKIDHHLAALGVQQQRQQLRALVLHLDRAAREDIHLVQGGLVLQPQAQGEYGVGTALMPALASSFCTSARLAVRALTRRSRPAPC